MDLCDLRSFRRDVEELRQFRVRRIRRKPIERKPQSHNEMRPKILSKSIRFSNKSYRIRTNPMEDLTDEEFQLRYRFSKVTMRRIINLLNVDLEVDTRGGGIPVDLQVMAVIRYWGCHEVQGNCAAMHGLSQQTLSDLARRVAIALASKSPMFIKMPANATEELETNSKFEALSGMQGITGVIDCTQVKIRKIGGESGQYHISNKGHYFINTQVVCDADLKICDIVCHWRGSTHNASVWRESSISRRFEEGEFVGRLVGDSGYPSIPHIVTPILTPTTPEEQYFHYQHTRTHDVIVKCIGLLKERFKILSKVMRGSYTIIKSTIIACAVLHNIAIMYEGETGAAHAKDEEVDGDDDEEVNGDDNIMKYDKEVDGDDNIMKYDEEVDGDDDIINDEEEVDDDNIVKYDEEVDGDDEILNDDEEIDGDDNIMKNDEEVDGDDDIINEDEEVDDDNNSIKNDEEVDDDDDIIIMMMA